MLIRSVDDFSTKAEIFLQRRLSFLRVRCGVASQVEPDLTCSSPAVQSSVSEPVLTCASPVVQAKIELLHRPFYDEPSAEVKRQLDLEEIATIQTIASDTASRWSIISAVRKLSFPEIMVLGAGLVAVVSIGFAALGGPHKVKELTQLLFRQ